MPLSDKADFNVNHRKFRIKTLDERLVLKYKILQHQPTTPRSSIWRVA